ncbi:Protein of unknown function [Bacillus thuringiensis]|uniref:Uncharacterized protein n=2 Tax=Bacillus cereus group TaxID=86661 RepID=A0A1C4APJ3_BACTU|nr:Protein of unknown function [Bacillus thuringiensis]
MSKFGLYGKFIVE